MFKIRTPILQCFFYISPVSQIGFLNFLHNTFIFHCEHPVKSYDLSRKHYLFINNFYNNPIHVRVEKSIVYSKSLDITKVKYLSSDET